MPRALSSPTSCFNFARAIAWIEAMSSTEGAATIDVVINGEPRAVPAGLTIAGLIDHLGLGGKRVAVERNRAIAPRATHASVIVEAGDRLELVTFVGGG